MNTVSRRSVLAGTTGAALAAVLAGCSDSPTSGSGVNLTWWDHFGPLQALQQETFEKFEANSPGTHVEYTWLTSPKMAEALQLAKRSGNLPDVSSLGGLNVPVPRLIESGWLQPITLTDTAMASLEGVLFEGIHIFDGELYSFPLFSFRQYNQAVWMNTDVAGRAGLDVETSPATYDEFRAAAQTVRKNLNGVYGFVWNAGSTAGIAGETNDLVQAAGFAGANGVLYESGEYAYHSDPYLHVLEFLQSLQTDGLLRPGSTSWNGDEARSHWMAGEACFYFDGPWLPGVVLQASEDFSESFTVGSMLVPESGTTVAAYHEQAGGCFWLSKSSGQADAVNQLLSDFFVTDDYNKGIANAMDQPPRDLSVVAESSAHPAYKALLDLYQTQAFLAPNPLVRNPDVAAVQAELRDITPSLGDIVQGALTGDVTDVKGALKTLSDESSEDRDRALEAAKKKGANVDLGDFAFPTWRPQTDFTEDMYERA